jgi:aminoglycoside phosphotransferase (APT) family kinase protein
LRAGATEAVEAFERLSADPCGTTYGFFDGHGWNMAFDHARGCLNGIYDFADSGIGPLHQDFIYTNFISPDLTERVAAAYDGFTGRALERRRIMLLTGIHRLSELAELADQPEHVASMIRHFAEWARMAGRGE